MRGTDDRIVCRSSVSGDEYISGRGESSRFLRRRDAPGRC